MTDSPTGDVRVKAVCVFRHAARILAIDGTDPSVGERFWVPVGGGVEFRETSRAALIREVQEELSTQVTDLELLGVLENLFTFDGVRGHEIVFVYDGRLMDLALYATDPVIGRESDGQPFTAHWIDPFDVDRPVYPDGLVELIERG